MPPAGRSWRDRPVLVAGGAGFIGSRIAARLCRLRARVTVVDSLHPRCGGNLFNLRELRDEIELVEEPVEDFAAAADLSPFAAVIDCVGLTDHRVGFAEPELDYAVNCAAGLALLRGLERAAGATRLVSFGTRNQYGRPRAGRALRESDPLDPLDLQAIHKTALEQAHRAYRSSVPGGLVFFRLTNTFGPGQRLEGGSIGFAGELLLAAVEGRPLVVYGSLDRVKDLLFVEEVVDAVLAAAATDGVHGVFNVGGNPCRIGELVAAIEDRVGPVEVSLRDFPARVARIETGDAVLDCGALGRACGWAPSRPLVEAVGETLDYFRAHRRHYLAA